MGKSVPIKEILEHPGIADCLDFKIFDYKRIQWVSPIARNCFYEYRDNFLDALDLIEHQEQLRKFWPNRGPVWDGLGVMKVQNECNFLLEPKSYVREMITKTRATDPRSIRLIQKSLAQVKHYMGVTPDADWTRPYYQLCNRLALLYFLNIITKKSSYLALVNFVDDSTIQKPTSAEQWKSHYKDVFSYLGITSKSKLTDRIISVYPIARS